MAKRQISYKTTFQPWWLRVLEHQGLPTVFALALLYAAWVWGGDLIKSHAAFLKSQSMQMELQTEQIKTQTGILKIIADSAAGQEKKLEAVNSNLQKGIESSGNSHEMIMEMIKKNGTK